MIKMKDSGIEWIGFIPQKWSIFKIKDIGKYINGYAFKPDDWSSSGIPIIRIQDLTGSSNNPNYYNGEIDEKYKVVKGDILVSWAASLNAFIWNKKNGWLNQHIFKAIPNERLIIKEYFIWVLKLAMENMNNDNKHGIMMQHVTLDVFNNFKVVIPNLDEQKNISEILNKKVKEIDNVIKKTKETIDDYKKIKYSLIFDKITKGMKKNIELKETGNIHIGKIPSNWSAKKIKYIFEIKKDIAGKEGYDILSITQNGIKVKDISKNEGQLAANYSNYQLVDVGDFAMNHMDLLTGWVDISKYNGVTSPDYRVFRFINRDNNDSKYYLYLMQMCYIGRIFYDLGQGVSNMGRWRLQTDKFLNFVVPNPPIKEQKEISDYLERKCNKIDKLILNKEKLIEELEQYKKSIIYEYVTGKKEVV